MDTAEIIALGADAVIILGAIWIGVLFRRTYRRSRETRTMILSITFFALAAYFSATMIANAWLKLERFKWMESEAALELMMMIMIVALATVLGSIRSGWKGLKLTEKRDENKAA